MKKTKFYLLLFICTLFTTNALAQKGSNLLIEANKATLEHRYTDAIGLYNQYIKMNPKDFRGYFNLGTTQYNAAQYDAAVASFSKTLGLNPVYKEAYYYRGLCNHKLNKHSLAIQDYNHVLNRDPQSVPFLKLRSEAYHAMNLSDNALADLNKAIEVDRLSGDLYKRRAELKVNMNDLDGALRDYNAVEKLIPEYKMVHYIKGNLYLAIEETDFACEEYQEALNNKVVVAERSYQKHCSSGSL